MTLNKKMDNFHTSVLLKEAIDFLNIKKGKKYIDATLGGGGHSRAILDAGGILLSVDQDEEAIDYVVNKYNVGDDPCVVPKIMGQTRGSAPTQNNWIIKKGNFAEIEEIAKETGFVGVAGVLFDLGVSNHQFDDKTRGFSFDSSEELDMRMDKDLGVKASVLVNGLSKKELAGIFEKYGEEQFAIKIAGDIEYCRRNKPILTCRELSEICRRVYLKYEGYGSRIHPATKVFQALRIIVNSELENLEHGLTGAYNILEKHGRIVVISFHSLEDRIVKKIFRDLEEMGKGKLIGKEIVKPSEKETSENPKSRSAKLRVIEKI